MLKAALLLVFALLFAGCTLPFFGPQATPTPAPTPEPTASPVPTPSPTPTSSPVPTQAPPDNLTAYSHRYAVVASGYSGNEQHAAWFRASTLGMYNLLTKEYNFSADDVYYLHEYTNYSEVDYEATRGNFYGVMNEIQNKSTAEDLVFIYLVGHGNEGAAGTGGYTFTDGDLGGAQFATLLNATKAKRIVIIMTECNSGAFVSSLSGPGRVILTSTEAPETNQAGFADYITDGLRRNATISDAFQRATDGVARWYRDHGRDVILEHPLLDDNGDGAGHRAPLPADGDGYLAANTTLRWG